MKTGQHTTGEGRGNGSGCAVHKLCGATNRQQIQHLLCEKKGGAGVKGFKS